MENEIIKKSKIENYRRKPFLLECNLIARETENNLTKLFLVIEKCFGFSFHCHEQNNININ